MHGFEYGVKKKSKTATVTVENIRNATLPSFHCKKKSHRRITSGVQTTHVALGTVT